MRRANLFGTVSVLIIALAIYLATDWLGEEKHPVIQNKIDMQRADQIKRKGYEIQHHPGMVCGYYYWKDDMWNIDSYCVGRSGTVKVLPDSLTFFHRRMIEEVNNYAERKGYGGW